jgi:hypothetical protein
MSYVQIILIQGLHLPVVITFTIMFYIRRLYYKANQRVIQTMCKYQLRLFVQGVPLYMDYVVK